MYGPAKWICKFCHKSFVMEGKYLTHACKQMKRFDEARSPEGQTAWYYYQLWMRAMKKSPPPVQAFASSRYFRTFINFANFVKNMGLPKPETFIKLMTTKDFTPTMWLSNDVYTIYLEFLDKKLSPMKHADISIHTIFEYSERNSFDPSEFFAKVNINELIQMIQKRQISPWILLVSPTFKTLLSERADPEQQIIIQTLIRPETWGERLSEHAEDVAKIKLLVKELNV